MKNNLSKLILLTALLAVSACSKPATNKSSNEISSESKHQDITLFTEEPSSDYSEASSNKATSSVRSSSVSSSSISSSSETISSRSSSSSSSSIVDNQLSTSNGLVVKFKNNGASIDKITWKGKQIAKDGFVVGRCANRIAGGTFKIDGTTYNVSKNDGQNSLHGGAGSGMNSWRGPFATKDWTKVEQTEASITYTFHSADGENGLYGR